MDAPPSLQEQWSHIFGDQDLNSVGRSVLQTSDGAYIISGYIDSASENGNTDVYLIKTDADGNISAH